MYTVPQIILPVKYCFLSGQVLLGSINIYTALFNETSVEFDYIINIYCIVVVKQAIYPVWYILVLGLHVQSYLVYYCIITSLTRNMEYHLISVISKLKILCGFNLNIKPHSPPFIF